ncbi:MAG TPA: UDP-N-acetylmuramoyl-L-alanine--D-glutamate ligase [Steroidobacteraceae bacterium]|jgi:UDP-N-acetylmuramoylalanine--D-glutamate ligase|nr:UDP-N-acetylmuramoyl-L-alanine--D-glutamate ligase [Steroidobacteraceae bacterium]
MKSVVVGLGKTGASCVRYLSKRGIAAGVTDSREAPPGLEGLEGIRGSIDVRLGGFDLSLLDGASQVLMSPGVSLDEPIARAARDRGIEVVGDVELFARNVRAPVIGITGTNGKSTVTTLVARMAAAAGRAVLAGGNLGEPVLDLLEHPAPDLYVLELSSFQLETTSSLELAAAVVLNVTADHMDRYASIEAYARAKARIFAHAATVVLNVDDPRVAGMRAAVERAGAGTATDAALPGGGRRPDAAVPRIVTFSIERSDADFSLLRHAGGTFLAWHGERLLELERLKITGLHNAANALAALALGEAVGLPMPGMLATLESFRGLPHRSAWVADIEGVRYVDDSKGTNVGATIAAVEGMRGPLVMIAGGEGKGQDFTPLAAAFRGKVRHTVLIGKDAASVAAALDGVCPTETVASMREAVLAAARAAGKGDTVLLSPACASLDMFRDYGHRGDVFAEEVRHLDRRGS